MSSTVAEHTLQNEATNFDIALITYSEMSKKDFKLKCSSSLEDMIIGHEEREKAPVFLVLKNKYTGEYCDTSSVLRLQEKLYNEQLENTKADLKRTESVLTSRNVELNRLLSDKEKVEKDISNAIRERASVNQEIRVLERDKRKAEREFEDWKDDNPIFRFLYWLSQLIYD
ncbi:TPA: hypothetical protein ACYSZO_000161 [Streptococcus suis]